MTECDHLHTTPAGLAEVALDRALSEAERRCSDAGERMTAPRRRALELLLRAGKPMKAYDLIDNFGEDGQAAKPPTVYRALDFLSRQGFAHRIESLNAYVACAKGDETHVAAFLICDCCGESQEIDPFEPGRVQAAAAEAGYVITGVTVEAHGRCAACV